MNVSRTSQQHPLAEALRYLTQERNAPSDQVRIPLTAPENPGTVDLRGNNGRISLVVRGASIDHVIGLIAEEHGLNVVASSDVQGQISVTLSDVLLEDALDAILTVNGYIWTQRNNILLITKLNGSKVAPTVQRRAVRVFNLNYLGATDTNKVVEGLLSPAGTSFAVESVPTSKLKTREQIVVEDLPEYLDRIAAYIEEVDQPPKQVLIEAYVLQIDLKDEKKHGIDFQQLVRIDGADLNLITRGFTDPAASPAFFMSLTSTDLTALIELLQTTRDAKTLASPKVLALNGQEARIQIGAQLGYLVTTTTQTSTLQQVEFLDVGVVLRVTPQISEDNKVLMTVLPEVSSGEINEITGLPEEETTEVQTTLMLEDGQAMVIGGLIQETDIDNQVKIPILGDLWLVGRFFQRKSLVRERSEIIIALIPRVVPYAADYQQYEGTELHRATTRLMDGRLNRIDRRHVEPMLPDAMGDPRKLDLHRVPDLLGNFAEPRPDPVEYYFPTPTERSDSFPGYLFDGVVPYDSSGRAEPVPVLPGVMLSPANKPSDDVVSEEVR